MGTFHFMLLDQRLSKISRVTCPGPRNEVAALTLDGNNLSTLTGVESYAALIQVLGEKPHPSLTAHSEPYSFACCSCLSVITVS